VILNKIKYYRYEIPLLSPLYINKIKTTKRSGIIIRLMDTEQNTGFGEIAPLPGLHSENLETVINLLNDTSIHVLNNSISDQIVTSNKELSGIFKINTFPPSIQFGVSLAVLDLLSNSKRIPFYKLFNPIYNKSVPVNGLLIGTANEILMNTEALIAEGYTTLKIKVGKQSLDNDIFIVKKVSAITGEKIKIRLDANQAWSLNEALYFAGEISDVNIEYIEEPLKHVEELPEFSQISGLPVALDESLTDYDPVTGKFPNWVKAIILKPSVIGDINRTIQFIKQAKIQNIIPVISSTFESGLTLNALAQLASIFMPKGTAVGIDTFRWLSQDLLTTPFKIIQGKVNIEDITKNHINLQSSGLFPLNR